MIFDSLRNLAPDVWRASDKTDGTWTSLTPKPQPMVFDFVFDPEVNGGEVSFVFTNENIASGAELVMKKFDLVEVRTK